MKNLIEIKKKITSDWFKSLQERIVNEFQLLENKVSEKKKGESKIFIRKVCCKYAQRSEYKRELEYLYNLTNANIIMCNQLLKPFFKIGHYIQLK